MVPVKLLCHFETNHSKFKEKGIEYFNLDAISSLKGQHCVLCCNIFVLYYNVFQTRNEKSHWSILQGWLSICIGWRSTDISQESFTADIAECLLDEKSDKEITALSLCNNTVIYPIKD